jgi:hypothetical protein
MLPRWLSCVRIGEVRVVSVLDILHFGVDAVSDAIYSAFLF